MRVYQNRGTGAQKSKNAPLELRGVESHSQLRELGIRSMRSGISIRIALKSVFFEARAERLTLQRGPAAGTVCLRHGPKRSVHHLRSRAPATRCTYRRLQTCHWRALGLSPRPPPHCDQEFHDRLGHAQPQSAQQFQHLCPTFQFVHRVRRSAPRTSWVARTPPHAGLPEKATYVSARSARLTVARGTCRRTNSC